MKQIRRLLSLIAVTSVALATGVAHAQSGNDAPTSRNGQPLGAGSTFAAPIIQSWLSDYASANPGFQPTYEATGSGDGVTRFLAGELDFGATDEPVAAGVLPDDALQLPVIAGMISVVYNVPGVESELTLPRDVYADIFLGRISRWDDPRIAASNPGVDLPSKLIQLVARQDGSGTTFAFTNHLAAISEIWRDGPGVAKAIDWLGATMLARGNEGVAQRIKLTLGSIGYVESGFASRLGMPVAALENAAGTFVAPTLPAGQAALAPAEGDGDALTRVIVDPVGEGAYPIVTYTWWLQHRDHDPALVGLLRWALQEGQASAEPLGFLPLSEEVVRAALARIDDAAS